MGFEQLVQRAVDLEAVEKIADAAECLDFAYAGGRSACTVYAIPSSFHYNIVTAYVMF